MKNLLKWLATLAVTLLLLAVVFRQVPLDDILSCWGRASLLPLLAALAVSFVTNCWLSAEKWRYILKPLGLALSPGETFLVKMGSMPVKSVLPARAGESSRVFYLYRRHDFSLVKSTASIMIELVTNLLVFCVYVVAGGLLLRLNPYGAVYVIGTGLAAALLLAIAFTRPTVQGLAARLADKVPWPTVRGGLKTFLGIHRYYSWRRLLVIMLYSFVIQSGKLLTFLLINFSFGTAMPAVAYVLILPLSVLVSSIPITILGLGLREGALEVLLGQYAAIPTATVLGTALIFSMVEYIFPVLLGAIWTRRFMAGMIEKT